MARLTSDPPNPEIIRTPPGGPTLWDVTDQLIETIKLGDQRTYEQGVPLLERALKLRGTSTQSFPLPWSTSAGIDKSIVGRILGAALPKDLVEQISAIDLDGEATRSLQRLPRAMPVVIDPFQEAVSRTLNTRYPVLSISRGPNIHITWLSDSGPAFAAAQEAERTRLRHEAKPRATAVVSSWMLFVLACEDAESLSRAATEANARLIRDAASHAMMHIQ